MLQEPIIPAQPTAPCQLLCTAGFPDYSTGDRVDIIDLERAQRWKQNNSLATSARISDLHSRLNRLLNNSNERNVGFIECSVPLCEIKALMKDATIQRWGPPFRTITAMMMMMMMGAVGTVAGWPFSNCQQLWLIPTYRVTAVMVSPAERQQTRQIPPKLSRSQHVSALSGCWQLKLETWKCTCLTSLGGRMEQYLYSVFWSNSKI